MKIHEYQAKELIAKYGVPVAAGGVAHDAEEAVKIAQDLGGDAWAVKAQIHAGGRGKGGGVKIARSLEEVQAHAQAILGMRLVTPQTDARGQYVKKIYIEQGSAIRQELYCSVLLDRKTGRNVIVASAAGGMDIEEVAEKTPDAIIREVVDPAIGLCDYQCRHVAFSLGLEGKTALKTAALIKCLYKAYAELDASLVEINPLVITDAGAPIALDAKMAFDENVLFRHADLEGLRDLDEEDPTEHEAQQHALSYIKLDGNIGCMVNGAGLAMATMDAIKLHGGDPANFLDVGGGAPKERVAAAFRIILSDTSVQGILVNIFGGIMRCDVIAEGILAAAEEIELRVPLVVRLEGTNVAQGKKMLENSGLAIMPASDLGDAAKKIVKVLGGLD